MNCAGMPRTEASASGISSLPEEERAVEEPLIHKEDPGEEPLNQRPFWRGNTNIYLATASFIIIWFVLQRGIWRFQCPISTPTATHVIAACLFGTFCCVNVFYTPSHGPIYRTVHVWLGRVAMLIGFLSVSTGIFVLYTEGMPLAHMQ